MDGIAAAGVLTVEPGTFSYGLGNLVLGRVIEIVIAQSTGTEKRFSAIMEEMLFKPLGMSTAAFYLQDGDPRIAKFPELYGSTPDRAEKYVPYAESLPPLPAGTMVPPNTTATDSFSGPRKCDSGDTGTCMTVDDYSKFYDFLHADGITPDGVRLLKPATVQALTKKKIRGLRCDNGLAAAFGVNGAAAAIPQSFRLGWCVKHPDADVDELDPTQHTVECEWSGYANNRGTFYPDDDAYCLIFPQVMAPSPGGFAVTAEIHKARGKILSLWN